MRARKRVRLPGDRRIRVDPTPNEDDAFRHLTEIDREVLTGGGVYGDAVGIDQ